MTLQLRVSFQAAINFENTNSEASGPDSSDSRKKSHLSLFFSLHTDPPTRTQTGPLIYAEQTQTFPYIPTGTQTSVRPRDDHTGKQTTTLNGVDSTRTLN